MVLMLVCSIVCSARELGETVVVLMEDQESFHAGLGWPCVPSVELGTDRGFGQQATAYATSRRPADVMHSTADAIHKRLRIKPIAGIRRVKPLATDSGLAKHAPRKTVDAPSASLSVPGKVNLLFV